MERVSINREYYRSLTPKTFFANTTPRQGVMSPSRPLQPASEDVFFSGQGKISSRNRKIAYAFLASLGIFGYFYPSSAKKTQVQLTSPHAATTTITDCQVFDKKFATSSDAGLIRREIHRGMGLTGKGVQVFFFDVDQMHFESTKAYVEKVCQGVAPDVTLTGFVDKSVNYDEMVKQPFEFSIDMDLVDMSNKLEDLLQSRLKSGDKTPWVINASIGISKTIESQYVLEKLQQEDPKAIAAVYGTSNPNVLENRSYEEMKQDVARFIQQQHTQHRDAFEKSLKRYQDVTRRLAESGVFIVVSAGNDHNDTTVIQAPGDDVNYLTMSQHVFSAAASNMNGTPENRADDTIADFSSRGDGRYNPTTALPGVRLLNWESGTSYSAPLLSGYIALMLEKNPNLTFKEVKTLIQLASVDTKAPRKAEGAGMLDPVKLLKLTPKAEKIA